MLRPTILVLGAGSIGKRHVRNLLASGLSPEQLTVADPREDRRKEVLDLGVPGPNVLADRDIALAHRTHDGAIVATPTALHYDDAVAVAPRSSAAAASRSWRTAIASMGARRRCAPWWPTG